ncbi:histidine kinase family protein [Asticcacaulis biprosthecium C19]|uniref:Histidine kinase family protein n=1 Tax=Asticcacaulis biprosthecium C19 TaxID=715226 RepID=F4QMM9_9CAUL|nr:histidine kinase [Asticcacaulis biprosthecium]EGF91470.1 histidine kinase family protein [Asticcacaulis biprosthecium C19]
MRDTQKRLLTRAATLLGIWVGIGLLTAGQWYMYDLANSQARPWKHYIGPAMVANVLWACVTPIVFSIANRITLQRGRAVRFILTHFAIGLVVSVCHTLIFVMFMSQIDDGWYKMLPHKLAGSLQINVLIYAMMVAIVTTTRALRHLNDRELQAAQMETQLAEAETASLRAQLQPHFLFNALNAISALVRSEPLKAERMIARLGELLRLSIDGHRGQESSLGDELDFTEAYLAIEEARLGERLTVIREIAPEALTATVPSLLLQPLVENAIRHGISGLPQGGTVTISAKVTEACLHIVVADDGAGAASVTEGVGLANTRRRLTRLYGERQSLTMDTAPGRGFRVKVKVPLCTAP